MQEAQIIEYELTIRLTFFMGIFTIMSILEYLIPKRKLILPKINRWTNNIALVFLNSFLLRIIFPTAAIGIAITAEQNTIGLFNLWKTSSFVSILSCVILLDLIIYTQHRLFHSIGFFWMFHKVHHSDMDYDLTTGFRFHPIEIGLSMCIKITFIFILGVPVAAVILFEVLLSTLAIFNHSNIHISKKIDTILRYFIVTPDMHRIHHSIESNELNSNYGFNLSVWDRLFKSYTKDSRYKDTKIIIGLKDFQDKSKTVSILSILKLPFLK